MLHYDGPAFYRRFTRAGVVNKARKEQSIHEREQEHQQREHSSFVADTQRRDFSRFKPVTHHYHIDLQNNPIAKITKNFHPRSHYGTKRVETPQPARLAAFNRQQRLKKQRRTTTSSNQNNSTDHIKQDPEERFPNLPRRQKHMVFPYNERHDSDRSFQSMSERQTESASASASSLKKSKLPNFETANDSTDEVPFEKTAEFHPRHVLSASSDDINHPESAQAVESSEGAAKSNSSDVPLGQDLSSIMHAEGQGIDDQHLSLFHKRSTLRSQNASASDSPAINEADDINNHDSGSSESSDEKAKDPKGQIDSESDAPLTEMHRTQAAQMQNDQDQHRDSDLSTSDLHQTEEQQDVPESSDESSESSDHDLQDQDPEYASYMQTSSESSQPVPDHSDNDPETEPSSGSVDDQQSAMPTPFTNVQNSPEEPGTVKTPEYHHKINYRPVSDYNFPPLDLLNSPQKQNDQGLDDWILNKAEVLNKTLKAFKVNAQVVDWTNGPTVTQFQVKLHLGVKVSKIRHLADDLKMALAAKDIRIEAPIPGKTTCGIEIPNPKPRPVMLSEVVDSNAFKNAKSPLTISLGVDLSGHPRVADLRTMPHGLIAGATGSGKSVFINSLLISLLYRTTPDQLRMILIDPKAVELAPYNGIPHLLSPVISEPKQAAAALKWTVKEMDERYDKLAAAGVRNIKQFNQKAEDSGQPDQKMPYILIVIDELADLMMVASDAVEAYIVRITQKARAAGIHLIVATQRPSVDIVTGTIKNNIPTRVAFMVSSQVDSRTIIDQSGAERLLGKGDMLYLGSGNGHPIRLQGCFVSSGEVERVTNFVRQQESAQYAFQPGSLLKKVNRLEQEDDLMPNVLAYIAKEKTVSTSKLQRVFSIGYNRAAKLIDNLEQRNFISGQQGSKPRDVYLTADDYKKLNL